MKFAQVIVVLGVVLAAGVFAVAAPVSAGGPSQPSAFSGKVSVADATPPASPPGATAAACWSTCTSATPTSLAPPPGAMRTAGTGCAPGSS